MKGTYKTLAFSCAVLGAAFCLWRPLSPGTELPQEGEGVPLVSYDDSETAEGLAPGEFPVVLGGDGVTAVAVDVLGSSSYAARAAATVPAATAVRGGGASDSRSGGVSARNTNAPNSAHAEGATSQPADSASRTSGDSEAAPIGGDSVAVPSGPSNWAGGGTPSSTVEGGGSLPGESSSSGGETAASTQPIKDPHEDPLNTGNVSRGGGMTSDGAGAYEPEPMSTSSESVPAPVGSTWVTASGESVTYGGDVWAEFDESDLPD